MPEAVTPPVTTETKSTRQLNSSTPPERSLWLPSQPLFRYDRDHPDVLDAALFAFVEGTDPELVLLLEARRAASGVEWHYAVGRMRSIRLRLYDRETDVWQPPALMIRRVQKRRTPFSVRDPMANEFRRDAEG